MTELLDMLKGQLDPDSYRKLIEVRSSMEKRFMRLTDETNVVRVLPSIIPGKLWFREVQNHFRVGGMDKKGVTACNTYETPSGPCFICDVMNYLKLSAAPQDQEYAKALRPSRIYWVNAYHPKADIPTVKILPLSYTTFQQLFQLFLSGEDSFLNTENGVNVIINKQPGNKYFVRLDRTSSPIASEDLLEQRHDLEKIAQEQRRAYEEQMAMYPPELIKAMREAGVIKTPGSIAPSVTVQRDLSGTAAVETKPGSSPEDVKASMANLMAQVTKGSTAKLEGLE